jgi:hypothetical protein
MHITTDFLFVERQFLSKAKTAVLERPLFFLFLLSPLFF